VFSRQLIAQHAHTLFNRVFGGTATKHAHLLRRDVLQAARRVRLHQRVPAGRAADELQAIHSPPGRPALQVPQHGRVGRGRLHALACSCVCVFVYPFAHMCEWHIHVCMHTHVHVSWVPQHGRVGRGRLRARSRLQHAGVSEHGGASREARALLLGAPACCRVRALLPRRQRKARTGVCEREPCLQEPPHVAGCVRSIGKVEPVRAVVESRSIAPKGLQQVS